MASHHSRNHGLYRHSAPVKDKERPNFIFSSDIPYKIATCVTELHLYQGGYSSRSVDLAKYIQFFDITLELNALLLRNKSITPSELVTTNSVYVAKIKTPGIPGIPRFDHGIKRSISRFPEVWKSILSMQKCNETFVVNFRLELDQFSVDLANVSDIRLLFHANDTFSPLLSSDIALTDHLKSYIRQKLLQELKNNSDISLHITDSSTILQDSPPNDHIAQFQSMYGCSAQEPLDFANTSLDGTDTSYVIDKQMVLYDDDDFDNSGDEMKILHSDESGKFNSNEDEDSDENVPVLDQSTHLGVEHLDRGVSTISLSSSRTSNSTIKPGNEEKLAEPFHFCSDLNNNQSAASILNKGVILCDLSSQNAKPLDGSSTPKGSESPKHKEVFLEPGEPTDECNPSFGEFSRSISEQNAESDDTLCSPMVSPIRKDTYTYGSGTQSDAPQLKKKASISFIDHDDGHGLKFAYRDSSSSVPEYIKENKKFKFIKVGKVQKFVNMFEEHKETASNPSSRVNTRPGSPVKHVD